MKARISERCRPWAGHDFQKVAGVLNLPPGWRLFAANGVDRMDGSWIQRWTLLDFFIVLIIALAVLKLRNGRWRSHRFEWNGPVQSDQTLRLWLVPMVNFLLAILRVLLLGAFILGVVSLKTWWATIRTRLKPDVAVAELVILLILPLVPTRSLAASEAFPPPALLKQLENRLLEKPDCLPACAAFRHMELTVRPAALQILLEVHAAVQTAVPLPVTTASWSPEQVMIDQKPAPGLARDAAGRLWILVAEGIHSVALTGRIPPGQDTLQIPFTMRPHSATYAAEGWQVVGIDRDGNVAGTVQLTAKKPTEAGNTDFKNNVIPSFLHVQRTLHLGLTWQVSTTVTRITPPGASVVVSIPLLGGESVTTPDIDVQQGAVLIDMGPTIKQIRWDSVLALSHTLPARGAVTRSNCRPMPSCSLSS